MRRTAYLDHPDFMGHRTGPRHPETLSGAYSYVAALSLRESRGRLPRASQPDAVLGVATGSSPLGV